MFDIVGIGSALVDITINVEDSFLEKEKLPKGGMTLVDGTRSNELIFKFHETKKDLSPGGATANVMASFALCGGKGAFVGKVGSDTIGEFFRNETEKAGVRFLGLPSKTSTGKVLCFITPDGQRTFATHLGAAVEMKPEELPADFLNQAPILHVEAYLVFNRELILHILETAKKNHQKVSFDLSSFNVVRQNLDFLKEITSKNIDILFANEDESLAFTGLPPRPSLDLFSTLCPIAIVKEGAEGSHIAEGENRFFIPPEKVTAIDTNGAGDAYAGGVLFGISRGIGLEISGRIGSKAGALAVSQRGARLNVQNADLLKKYVSVVTGI